MSFDDAEFNVLRKLLGRSTDRPSRFQTRRGEVATLPQLWSIAPAVWGRASRRPAVTPWIAPNAVEFLGSTVKKSDHVLELGGGASTAWFATRAHKVTTVEPDVSWADQIDNAVRGHTNVEVVRQTARQFFEDGGAEEIAYDVVIVDHNPTDERDLDRQQVLDIVLEWDLLPPTLVLDDSDRSEYSAPQVRAGNRYAAEMRFRGFRSFPLQLTETAIWQHPK